MGNSTLTPAEKDELERLEGIIQRGQAAYIGVAMALESIHAAKLYRESHGSFEAYVKERWGLSRAYAYNLAAAGRLVIQRQAAGLEPPSNERQARAMLRPPKPPGRSKHRRPLMTKVEVMVESLSSLHRQHPQSKRLDEILLSYLSLLYNPLPRPGPVQASVPAWSVAQMA